MKKALIIGASSGMGKALAEILTKNDYKTGITGRRVELLQSIQNLHPDKIVFRQIDVQEVSSLEFICNEIVNELGGLHLLVISAGIGEENKSLDFSIDDDVIKTDILGFTSLANWGMRYFKNQGYGHLVNISCSIAGIRGNGQAPSYSATKAFQINYLEGLRLNAYKCGISIDVTDIRPCFVNTDMAKGEGLFWVAPVEKAAQQIFLAIKRKKKAAFITKRWLVLGSALKILPYSILKKL
ncbi:MAG TPA: SDR family NAD(P)-dependent oxidoreductase [Chitinophagaceae bacterium]|nr:SDR family NAD(P)-dependent oxidoreductase [Chitinophagaceae bacterium]